MTQGLDANVQNLVPTPVAIAMLPDRAALNLELGKSILARERTQESHSHSNLGGWQSSWDIAEWGGAAAQRVVEAGISLANRLTADRQGKPVKIDWQINALGQRQ